MSEYLRSRRDLGFPDGITFTGLFVATAARCLVAGTISPKEHAAAQRLFIREFDAPTYAELPWPERCNSFQDPLLRDRRDPFVTLHFSSVVEARPVFAESRKA
jgi:hypothetical protein